jgi:hypothetical protein
MYRHTGCPIYRIGFVALCCFRVSVYMYILFLTFSLLIKCITILRMCNDPINYRPSVNISIVDSSQTSSNAVPDPPPVANIVTSTDVEAPKSQVMESILSVLNGTWNICIPHVCMYVYIIHTYIYKYTHIHIYIYIYIVSVYTPSI